MRYSRYVLKDRWNSRSKTAMRSTFDVFAFQISITKATQTGRKSAKTFVSPAAKGVGHTDCTDFTGFAPVHGGWGAAIFQLFL